MSIQDILLAILGGEVDDDFALIQDAIKQRKDALTSVVRAEMHVGTRVRFNEQTRPKYLQGALATVTGFKQKNVTTELDETVGRFRAGSSITTPVGLLDIVD